MPVGTVTFLFTDIVGSTTLWEAQREAMRIALVRHDALLRRCIATGSEEACQNGRQAKASPRVLIRLRPGPAKGQVNAEKKAKGRVKVEEFFVVKPLEEESRCRLRR